MFKNKPKPFNWLITNILILPTLISGQSESRITYLEAGNLDLETTVNESHWQVASINPSHFHWPFRFDERHNPSYLFSSPDHGLKQSISAPVLLNLGQLFHLNQTMTRSLNSITTDFRDTNVVISQTSGDIRLKSQTRLVSGSLKFRLKHIYFNLALDNLFFLRNTLYSDGLRAGITTAIENVGASTKLTMNSRLQNYYDTSMHLYGVNVKAAIPFSERWIYGLQMGLIHFQSLLQGHSRIDASMLFAGDEFYFNDTETLWPTNLNQELSSNFRGRGFHARLGVSYLGRQNTILSLLFDSGSDIRCPGHLELKQNLIPALNVDALIEGEKDIEILNAEDLVLSRLNQTRPVHNQQYETLILRLPPYLQLTANGFRRQKLLSVTTRIYLSPYAIEYGPSSLRLFCRGYLGLEGHYRGFSSALKLAFYQFRSVGVPKLENRDRQFIFARFLLGYEVDKGPYRFGHLVHVFPIPGYQLNLELDL